MFHSSAALKFLYKLLNVRRCHWHLLYIVFFQSLNDLDRLSANGTSPLNTAAAAGDQPQQQQQVHKLRDILIKSCGCNANKMQI